MPKAKDQVKKPNTDTQKRNKKTEKLSQLIFSNGGSWNGGGGLDRNPWNSMQPHSDWSGGGDPDDTALNGNLSQHDARRRLAYQLRSYKKGRLKQAITPLNVRSRLHAILVLLYFQQGLYGNDALDKVRASRHAARQSAGMRRYETANDLHGQRERNRARQERERTARKEFEEEAQRRHQEDLLRASHRKQREQAHQHEQEDLNQLHAQVLESLWEKESRQEQAALQQQKTRERQTRAGAIVEVESASGNSPSGEPAGDTLIEFETDLQALTSGPAPTTESLIDIARRLEQDMLAAELLHGDGDRKAGADATVSGSSGSLASDISNATDDVPPWPGMTGRNVLSPEWQTPDSNTAPAASQAWPFGGAAGYDLLPRHENGFSAGQGRSGMLWSAIKAIGSALPCTFAFGVFTWALWPSSRSSDSNNSGDSGLDELIGQQDRHRQMLNLLPPAAREEWGSIEIDGATEDDSNSTPATSSTVDLEIRPVDDEAEAARGAESGQGETASDGAEEAGNHIRRRRSAGQEWGRVDARTSIWRVKGSSVSLNELSYVLYIDSEPEESWITVEMPLIPRRIGKDNRSVNFYYLLEQGYRCVVQPPHYYDSRLRKSRRLDCYKNNELKLTVQVRGEASAVNNSIESFRNTNAHFARLREQEQQRQEQEQEQQQKRQKEKDTNNGGGKPPSVITHTGPGTAWRVTSANTEQSKVLAGYDYFVVFNSIPNFSAYEIEVPSLAQGAMSDTRDIDITPLLLAGYSAEYSTATLGNVCNARIVLSKNDDDKFTIKVRGDEKSVKRIIQANQIRSSQIENAGSISRQSAAINQQLSEKNLSDREKTSTGEKITIATSSRIRSDIRPLPFDHPPAKTISLSLDNVHDNFTLPYGANGHWEFVIPDQEDEAGLIKTGSGRIAIGNIRHVGHIQSTLTIADQGVDRHGDSFISFNSNNKDFSQRIVSKNGNKRFNVIVKDILSQIALLNQRAYAAYKSDAGPFSDEFFVPDLSVNGTYVFDDSGRPIKFLSGHVDDDFFIESFNHDAEISVDSGREKSKRSIEVSDSLLMSEVKLPEDNTRPYRATFKNHGNGRILTIRAEFSSSNDAAKELAAGLRAALARNEATFSREMVEISTTHATAAGKLPANRDWAIRRWNKLSRHARDRAVDFNNRRRQKSEFYVRRHYTPGSVTPPPFKILRDALLIEHDGTYPGEKGDIYWENVSWKSTRSEDSDLYRSYFVHGPEQAAIPGMWNWHATSRLQASINNDYRSSIEFAVENDINEVKKYGAALDQKALEFGQLAAQIKNTHATDAAAILLLVRWMTGEEIRGVNLGLQSYSGLAVDRSKLIYAAFSKADAARLKTDHVARKALIVSLAYLLPETIRISTAEAEPDTPAKAEPPGKQPAGKEPDVREPAAKEPPAKEPEAKAPAGNLPAVKVPTVQDPVVREPASKEPAAKEPVPKIPQSAVPKVIEIRDKDSSDGSSGVGALLATVLGLVGALFVAVGTAAFWMFKEGTSAAVGAIGEFLGLLGEGTMAILVPAFESAAGTAGAGMNTASAAANAINELAEQYPEIFPKIEEDSIRKIHLVEFVGCGILIIVEGARTKESLEQVMDHPTTKKALDAIGNILVETGTAAACVASGTSVAADNPAIYRYLSGSRAFNMATQHGNDLGLLGAILSLAGGSLSFRSSYMPDGDELPAPEPVPAPVPVPPRPPAAGAKKPWWKIILQNLPGQGAP